MSVELKSETLLGKASRKKVAVLLDFVQMRGGGVWWGRGNFDKIQKNSYFFFVKSSLNDDNDDDDDDDDDNKIVACGPPRCAKWNYISLSMIIVPWRLLHNVTL